ncbi:MAG: class I SAM-dependent methyltransferase [Flavobacteriaceae bacterium]|nr:class I SAM-dependent methyltransferase [Flavobacteriaceae bacterium]
MSSMTSKQEEIVEWFNTTYSKRGSWYLRPRQAYYIYLELLQAGSNQKLLDVACGLGRLLDASKAYGVQQYGIDISPVAIKKAKNLFPNFNLFVANAEKLPFDDAIFDLITCIGSIERMLNKSLVFKEMLRVGKRNCRYCFLVRNSETRSWKFFKDFLGLKNKAGHQDAKTLKQWKDMFSLYGFKVNAIYPDQYPLQKQKQRSGLWLKKINFKKIIFSTRQLEDANEFIFLLEKND